MSALRSGRGFSLLELIVALAIVALLLGVAAPTLGGTARRMAERRAAFTLLDVCRGARVEALEQAARREVHAHGGREGLVVWTQDGRRRRLLRAPVEVHAMGSAAQEAQRRDVVVVFEPSGRTRTRGVAFRRLLGREGGEARLWRIVFDPVSGEPTLTNRGQRRGPAGG